MFKNAIEWISDWIYIFKKIIAMEKKEIITVSKIL